MRTLALPRGGLGAAVTAWSAVGIAVLLGLTSLVLVTQHRFCVVAEDMSDAVEGVHVSEELRGALVRYELLLDAAAASEPRTLSVREDELLGALRAARRFVDTPREARVLRDLVLATEAYVALDRTYSEERRRALRGQVLAGIDELSRINADQARALQARGAAVARWSRSSLRLAALAVPAAVLWFGGIVVWLNRSIRLPFERIERALAAYRSGVRAARVPLTGPAELRQVARTFNGVADALAVEESRRLRFLEQVAHDLRNPLMALRMAIDRMERSERDVSPRVRLLSKLAGRLERLTEEFTEASQLGSVGDDRLRLEWVEARQLFEPAASLMTELAPDGAVTLTAPPAPIVLLCDRTRIARALEDLIIATQGSVPTAPGVHVRIDADLERVTFLVATDAAGAAPAEAELAAAPREELPCGLATTRGVVEAHHGCLDVARRGEALVSRLVLPTRR